MRGSARPPPVRRHSLIGFSRGACGTGAAPQRLASAP